MSEINDSKDLDLTKEEQDLDSEHEEDEGAEEEKGEDAKDDKGEDSKKELTDEQRLAIHERNAKKLRRKLGIDKPQKSESKGKADGLDYGQKAFLIANGIKGSEETALVERVMLETGKSLDEVLEAKYFQAELKEMREIKASADALPKGTKRSGQSASNTVEYWLAKGELPPNTPENVQLRRDVVNARSKKETQGSKFTSRPVA